MSFFHGDRTAGSEAARLNRMFVFDGDAVFGVSAFVALDETGPMSEAGILRGRLKSYGMAHRTTVGRLVDVGFHLVPTFGQPHYTVLCRRSDEVGALHVALGEIILNPYYGGQEDDQ